MELTTSILKVKLFYNEIKILYPLWGILPNLKNKKYNHIHPYSNGQIKTSYTFILKDMG